MRKQRLSERTYKARKEYYYREAQKYIDELHAYCHVKGCPAIHECPESHARCSRKLGLDTAIAWRVAARMMGVFRREIDLDKIEYGLSLLSAFQVVIAYHDDKPNLAKLNMIITNCYCFLLQTQEAFFETDS